MKKFLTILSILIGFSTVAFADDKQDAVDFFNSYSKTKYS